MKKTANTLASLSIWLFSIWLLAGCGGGSSAITPPSLRPQALMVTTTTLPSGTVQTVYGPSASGVLLTASGGVAPYSWNWASTSGSVLPPGLTLTNGSIAGMPTTAGIFNIAVTVTDSQSPPSKAGANFTLTVAASSSSLQIISDTPPSGSVATIYNHGNGVTCFPIASTCAVCFLAASLRICPPGWRYEGSFFFKAQGGTPPYAWTWAAAANSALPPGINLVSNGSFRGTPTAAGNYNIVVTVTDSGSPPLQSSATYGIVIVPPPAPVIQSTPAPSAGALNLPYSFDFIIASGGQPPFTWSESGPLPAGMVFNSGGTLSGTPTTSGPFPVTVMVHDTLGQNAIPDNFVLQIVAHGFAVTGSMAAVRDAHTATLLNNGKVLVAGGIGATGEAVATAELFDPASGTFASTGSLATARSVHTATLLADGRVLIAGGGTANSEIYDPASASFTPTASMSTTRSFQTATLLSDGKVLVTGGSDTNGNPIVIAELYDPDAGTFTTVGDMVAARFGHTATLLNNGNVLLSGGTGKGSVSLATAELFDPASATFTATGTMASARYAHTATLLSNGSVVVTGGFDGSSIVLATAEVFAPASGIFTAAGKMETPRAFHNAVALSDGSVLVVGGEDDHRNTLSSAEIFDRVTSTFSPTGSMRAGRSFYTITKLSDGSALVTGGQSAAGLALSSAELYQ